MEQKISHDLSSRSIANERTSIPAESKAKVEDANEQPQTGNTTESEEAKGITKPEAADDIGEADETEIETPKMAHDSMVTVRLSEPPSLALDTTTPMASLDEEAPASPAVEDLVIPTKDGNNEDEDRTERRNSLMTKLRDSSLTLSTEGTNRTLQDELGPYGADGNETDSSEDNEEVNWEQLEKTEDEQTKDEETDNSTALLLARLEQENAKLATNPKSVKVQPVEKMSSSKPRPPSMAQLRKMVSGPTPSALRYSMLPPPPMTDLEFYAALVKDYQQTAARLPTLLSNKIRKGIPPPLRGVVWQSMSGARDAVLEEQYDRFCGESSPYELLIGKDLGRSFPGVDMFREPEGDGQRMLGRVLKSFSLYDTKIGYCQGLAFLVGPLLMHMPDKQAFCVLVRLMEKYDLRDCFLPDLSGLHVRIYQFRELLRLNLPTLSGHLEELQVETAYVSQWFLSFFAVTCPLPMLFRIYDVIFAEGASETLMRVALSLMRKNEARLLACTEMEDVMQLLLSRGLWDCYHYNADEFVHDFAGLSGIVTRERLSQLEQAYRESLIATANIARASDITTAASRFLGRIWASSSRNTNLAPGMGSAPGRPLSLLRRSTSKQSLASTLNSIEASSASVASSSSTDVSTLSRDSANADDEPSSRESTPVGPKSGGSAKTTEERYLHSQIEDLLTALSELQRSHALLSNQLQSEREERDEDRKAVRSLLDGLRKRAVNHDEEKDDAETKPPETKQAPEPCPEEKAASTDADDNDATPTMEDVAPVTECTAAEQEDDVMPSTEDLSDLLNRVENRFAVEDKRHRSSMVQSKSQLREELLNVKGQLANALSHTQDLSRRIHDMDHELSVLREQLREKHGHVRTLHQDKQRLEKQIHGMRTRVSSSSVSEPNCRDADSEWSGKSKNGGLREFKLGRSKSTPQAPGYNKRISSLPQNAESVLGAASGAVTPPNEHEALLLELVQAKTAEATAKQEAEEAKQKLEALRKSHGLASSESQPSLPTSTSLGVFSRLTGQATTPPAESNLKPTAATAGTSPNTGGFWGWRR
ncbi:GTPase activating protein [Pochonia chlamydosporia 170]|uniref:GTPase activating protein n=1 Tax=Pochonia chlamydosporia 170 TaxID=1380566 RepID=A0A179FCH9_METCM|nr:GTPase activating protein [Pochonia chlamydosporia 170]OAQ63186.2 GTPase activating protein [Pochonia chlamydosporia 170]